MLFPVLTVRGPIRHPISRLLMCLLALNGCARCAEGSASPIDAPSKVVQAPVAKPVPPLSLKPPNAPKATLGGEALAAYSADELASMASASYHAKKFDDAITLLHYAIAGGAEGRYNLSCYYALRGQVDASFYWLQQAAEVEGIDAEWADEDPDLEPLRNDRRWQVVASYLQTSNAHWATSEHHKNSLVVPTGYAPGTPIGVLIGLHGLGSSPEHFVDASYQELADSLQMALVGVSGTIPRGKNSFVWSEDAARDATQVRRALTELRDRLTVKAEEVVLFGFSQGAQMAFEIALQNPREFRGAIVMSPGSRKTVSLGAVKLQPESARQAFVCTCGADEHPGNVRDTKDDCAVAQRAGIRTELKLYPGVSAHAFPEDFGDAFPRWVRFILGSSS